MKSTYLQKNIYILNASNQILGRFISKLYYLVNKINNINTFNNNFIYIINFHNILITGTKSKTKLYHLPTCRPGNSKNIAYFNLQKETPNFIFKHVLKGMLNKSKHNQKVINNIVLIPFQFQYTFFKTLNFFYNT